MQQFNRSQSFQSAPQLDSQPTKPFWKWLPLIAASGIGTLSIGAVLLVQLLTPSIFYLIAKDHSASAHLLAELHEKLCKNSVMALKFNDTIVSVSFADRTEVVNDQKIPNNLALLGQCQPEAQTQPESLGKSPGTSLMRLSDRLVRIVERHRKQGNDQPIAVVITLQEAEPGADQPALDWQHLHNQFQKITDNRGIVTIIGPTGQLQEDLEQHLDGLVHLCPIANAQSCLEQTITDARKL